MTPPAGVAFTACWIVRQGGVAAPLAESEPVPATQRSSDGSTVAVETIETVGGTEVEVLVCVGAVVRLGRGATGDAVASGVAAGVRESVADASADAAVAPPRSGLLPPSGALAPPGAKAISGGSAMRSCAPSDEAGRWTAPLSAITRPRRNPAARP